MSVVAALCLAACSDGYGDDPGDDDPGALAATDPATSIPSDPPVTTAPPAGSVPTHSEPVVTSAEASSPPTSAPAPVCSELITPGVHEYTLTAGGADHPHRVFVPSSYARTPLPAVIDFHGLGSNGLDQANFSGYEALAEAEGFIVVHPTGVSDFADGPNSWQLVDGQGADERDDLAFANAVVDDLVSSWCADPTRIYSTGMSNGGFFTARLVCEMSDRIAAAVSVAGLYHPPECSPARAVPYQGIHGTDDAIVPFDGSGESTLLTPDSPPQWRVFFEQVIPQEFAEFAADAGCDAAPAGTSVGEDVVRYDYSNCEDSTPMAFFEVVGGGHTWPGSPMAALVEGGLGYTTDAIDATVDGWAFMSQHSLDS